MLVLCLANLATAETEEDFCIEIDAHLKTAISDENAFYVTTSLLPKDGVVEGMLSI